MFETNDHRSFDIGFPNFKTPLEIGSFSLDINREFENSKKSMRYFVKPSNPSKVNFDLRKGYDTMIKNEKGRGFHVLDWIVQNLDKFPIEGRQDTKGQKKGASGQDRPIKTKGKSASSFSQQPDRHSQSDQGLADVQTGLSEMKISKDDSKRGTASYTTSHRKPRNLNTDFVCRRGLLAKIMCTPYERNEGWEIAVIYHNGTYYLNEAETEQTRENEKRIMNDKECAWGWKFEQYLTSDSKDGVPTPDAQYNNCEAFHTVVRTQLKNHSLVVSGEIDALNVDKEKDTNYIELKTTKEITEERHEKNFKRFKLKKWWAQSYIIGVQEIVCGFKDENGVVHKLKFYDTKELPRIAEDLYEPWKPNVCLNFLDQFLSFIKSTIKTDDHKRVHILKWSTAEKGDPSKPVRCSQPVVDSEYNFLPDWYTDALK